MFGVGLLHAAGTCGCGMWAAPLSWQWPSVACALPWLGGPPRGCVARCRRLWGPMRLQGGSLWSPITLMSVWSQHLELIS